MPDLTVTLLTPYRQLTRLLYGFDKYRFSLLFRQAPNHPGGWKVSENNVMGLQPDRIR